MKLTKARLGRWPAEERPSRCGRAGGCRTLPMWEKLGKMIDDFLEGITIADLVKDSGRPDNYCI